MLDIWSISHFASGVVLGLLWGGPNGGTVVWPKPIRENGNCALFNVDK